MLSRLVVAAIFAVAFFVPGALHAQDPGQKIVGVTTGRGRVTISTTDIPGNPTRTIKVELDGRKMTEFRTGESAILDILAFYRGIDNYIVLRTDIAAGRCASTEIFVLTVADKEIPVTVSPKLNACVGEPPEIRFYTDREGTKVVGLTGYELRNNQWVKTTK